MGVNRALAQNVEQAVGRMVPTSRYSLNFSVPQYEVNFHIQYLTSVDENELIFKLHLYGDSEYRSGIEPSSANWPFSKVASSSYAYSPAGEAGSIVALKTLRSSAPLMATVIEPVRWKRGGTSPSKMIGDVFAIHPNRAYSTVKALSLTEVVVLGTKELVVL